MELMTIISVEDLDLLMPFNNEDVARRLEKQFGVAHVSWSVVPQEDADEWLERTRIHSPWRRRVLFNEWADTHYKMAEGLLKAALANMQLKTFGGVN
jgi:hypothetical protein